MEPRLGLRCLGEPVLTGPDGEPIRFKVRKHMALLVYLAVESRARHHRDHLADLLWGNLPEGDGRHSLATGLSMIRAKVGGDALESDRDHVRFACMRMDLDLDRLETGDVLASEFQPVLEIAGFLDGFEIPGSAEFMLWRERQRSRWLPLVREALVKRIDKCRRTGDFKQVEHLADRMLALDELSEEAVRAKMEARAFAGDRLSALKVFEAWKERLDEDLGAMPSALVEGMALRLRARGWERPSSSPIPVVPTDHWKNRPFVGRAAEYQALYEGWERTRRGEPGHSVLVGDSGIGKSTLADRLATAAGLEGAVTSRVQCYDVEREIPYATIAGLVHGLLDRAGASATPPEALAELSRTIPEVRQKFPSIPAPSDSQGETARILLTEAFHQLLTALAEEQPVILVVDDLHLADDASLAVLHLMMRRARGQPIMVVFATRLDGLDQSPQAARLRESADRLGIRTIELARMTDDEASELLSSLVPAGEEQPGTAARRALLRAAAGYPMVLELLVQDWQANGDRSLALYMEAMTADAIAGDGPIAAYRQILERITSRLDAPSRNVLNLASILGRRLNDLDSYRLADLTIGQTMSGMAELVRVRVLRERGDRLEFANELIRAQAYISVPSPLRRVLHAEIADRLLGGVPDGAPAAGLEIAWHCFRGGRPQEGIPHLLSGARDAMRGGAPHEAELALSSAIPSLERYDKTEANFLLVEAMQEEGRWADSLCVIESLRGGKYSRSDGLLDVLAAEAHQRLLDIGPDNLATFISALELIIVSGQDNAVRARALMAAAYVLYDIRDREIADRLFALATLIPESGIDEETHLRLLVAKAVLLFQVGRSGPAFAELRSKVQQLPTTRIASLAAVQALHGSSSLKCGSGEYELALDDASLANKMAVRLGNDLASATAAANVALCHGRLGNYEEQVRWGTYGEQILGPVFTGYRDIRLGFARAFGSAMQRQVQPALDAIAHTDARLPESIPSWMKQAWQLSTADVLQLVGRHREALEKASEALADGVLHHHALAGPFTRWVSLSAVASGNPKQACERLQGFRAKLEEFDVIDQAEILAADCWVEIHRRGTKHPARIRADQCRLSEKLGMLPAAVTTQLVRLGIFGADR